MREWEVEVKKQKAVIGANEFPEYFGEPQPELQSARGSPLQALSSFAREGE